MITSSKMKYYSEFPDGSILFADNYLPSFFIYGRFVNGTPEVIETVLPTLSFKVDKAGSVYLWGKNINGITLKEISIKIIVASKADTATGTFKDSQDNWTFLGKLP